VRDERGLANGIIGFVVMIIVVALLYTLMAPAIAGVSDTASSQTSDADAQSEITEAQQIWTYIPVFGLFLASLLVIARATFESGGPR